MDIEIESSITSSSRPFTAIFGDFYDIFLTFLT